MSAFHEPVTLRFRGYERTLPVGALAISFRRGADKTARTIAFLTRAASDSLPTTEDEDVLFLEARGEGTRGGVCPSASERSEAGPERPLALQEILQERVGPQRSEHSERSDGHAREDDATLARTIAIDLGEEDHVQAIAKLVAMHPRELIEEALRRALDVPTERIRSSRGAIFTAIVKRLASQHPHSSPHAHDTRAQASAT
jgi:hypothetical protein